MTIRIVRLRPTDVGLMHDLNALFGRAFNDQDTYQAARPSDAYLRRQLDKDHVIMLAAMSDDTVAGGLVAYVLEKLEQERSEIYIYDLAVDESFRRRGIAKTMIAHLDEVAAQLGAWVMYVQADYGDEPAVALYESVGNREDVMHFDIKVGTVACRNFVTR